MFIRDGDDPEQRTRFSRRAIVLGLGQLAALGALGGRLYQLQIMEQRRYALLAEDNRIAWRTLAPERGRILDRSGLALADNEEHYRLVVTPAFAGDLAQVIERLSQMLPITEEEAERVLVRARRQSSGLPIVVANDLTFEQVAAIGMEASSLPGVEAEVAWRRRYRHAGDVGLIVGMVGAVDRLALDDDPMVRLPGMRIGKSGVELALDQRLRGVGGTQKQEVDARGRVVRNLERSEPTKGADVVLTIDAGLQSRVMERVRRERRAGLVAVDVVTGAVIAAASVPSRDQSALKAQEWSRIADAPDDPLFDRALTGLYPPGSTLKMVTALAALEAGVVSLKERIECAGTYRYADQSFRCWNRSGHGSCDLHRALRESCDCYFYEIARRTGIGALASMGQRLGLGQTWQGLGRQRAGVMPTPDWKRARFAKPWHGGETLLAGIGQGFVLATPLQLAVMTARIASGRGVEPHLVVPTDRPGALAAVAPLDVAPAHLEAVRRGMLAVVNEDGGTGRYAQIDEDETGMAGVRLAGKTGTSQVSRRSSEVGADGLRFEQRDHALFVGYAPAKAPRIAVAAVVEHGASGGRVAAPLVRDVMSLLLASAVAGDPRGLDGRRGGPERKSG